MGAPVGIADATGIAFKADAILNSGSGTSAATVEDAGWALIVTSLPPEGLGTIGSSLGIVGTGWAEAICGASFHSFCSFCSSDNGAAVAVAVFIAKAGS